MVLIQILGMRRIENKERGCCWQPRGTSVKTYFMYDNKGELIPFVVWYCCSTVSYKYYECIHLLLLGIFIYFFLFYFINIRTLYAFRNNFSFENIPRNTRIILVYILVVASRVYVRYKKRKIIPVIAVKT